MLADINLNHGFILDAKFALQEATNMIKKILENALAGDFQNNTGSYQYKNKEYTRYKANGMNRLTHGNPGREKKLFKSGKKKGEVKTGQRLKGFEGISTNRDISKVNMFLTGNTLRNMRGEALNNGYRISFNAADTDKIKGNQKRGYDLVGLRDENKELTRSAIQAQLEKQIGEQMAKNIVITIG